MPPQDHEFEHLVVLWEVVELFKGWGKAVVSGLREEGLLLDQPRSE